MSVEPCARDFHLTLATYNVHRCTGADGRRDPDRIARVIKELRADLVGLQEIDSSPPGGDELDQLHYLASETEFAAIMGSTMKRRDSIYGNALLTRHEVLEIRRIDLSVPGREPRGAIDVDLQVNGVVVRAIVTHLGLSYRERQAQFRRLRNALARGRERVQILMGDFNEWYPLSRQIRPLQRYFGAVPYRPTFPSRFPIFALDRMWVRPGPCLVNVEPHVTLTSRVASDHLPLKGEVTLPRG